MAHNNIQYSEKYYDDVYEYRCGLGRPAGDACMSRKGAKSDVGSFVAGTLCCPLRLRNTCPRTVCCQRYCCSCQTAFAALLTIRRGSATWLLCECCRTNGGALVSSSPEGGSTMPSTGQSLISCCSGAATKWASSTIVGYRPKTLACGHQVQQSLEHPTLLCMQLSSRTMMPCSVHVE